METKLIQKFHRSYNHLNTSVNHLKNIGQHFFINLTYNNCYTNHANFFINLIYNIYYNLNLSNNSFMSKLLGLSWGGFSSHSNNFPLAFTGKGQAEYTSPVHRTRSHRSIQNTVGKRAHTVSSPGSSVLASCASVARYAQRTARTTGLSKCHPLGSRDLIW